MKNTKYKSLIAIILACTVFISCASPIFAATKETDNDEKTVNNAVDVDLSRVKIDDQFKDSEGIVYTVVDDAANIYVGSGDNQKHYKTGSVDTFEITYKTKNGNATYGVNDPSAVDTWRKYIRLEDLCDLTKKDGTPICEIMDATDYGRGEFYLKRLYKEKISESVYDRDNDSMDSREISLYYKSYHTTNSKQFTAMLQLVDENDDEIDTYKFYTSDETLDEAGKWDVINNESVMATDIETLIDNNGEVYVSLRFVSESLGAEVRWADVNNSKDGSDDDVYIEFYDDKEYCKGIDFTFTSGGETKDPKDVERSLYIKETAMENISLDGTYTYKDDNNRTRTSSAEWQKLYILLTIPSSYPSEFFDKNLPLGQRVVWIEDSGENYLRLLGNIYGKYSDGMCEVGNTTYDCDLGEEVSITGIILYKGVPVPIDIFNVNNEKCS